MQLSLVDRDDRLKRQKMIDVEVPCRLVENKVPMFPSRVVVAAEDNQVLAQLLRGAADVLQSVQLLTRVADSFVDLFPDQVHKVPQRVAVSTSCAFAVVLANRRPITLSASIAPSVVFAE